MTDKETKARSLERRARYLAQRNSLYIRKSRKPNGFNAYHPIGDDFMLVDDGAVIAVCSHEDLPDLIAELESWGQ